MKKGLKIAGAVLFAFAISAMVNYFLAFTSLGSNSTWRIVFNIIEILGIIVAVFMIMSIVTNSKKGIEKKDKHQK